MKGRIGLVGAIAAGAWLGLSNGLLNALPAILPSDDAEVHLNAMVARDMLSPVLPAVLSFATAYAAAELLRRRFGARWPLIVPVTCFTGSAVFACIRYMASPHTGPSGSSFDVVTMRAMLLTIYTVPVMAAAVALGHGAVRLTFWLGRHGVTAAS